MKTGDLKLSNRRCVKCGKSKPLSEYYADKSKSGGLRNDCKSCVRLRQREWNARNRGLIKEHNRAYYEQNRDSVLAQVADYRKSHQEERNDRDRARFWAEPRIRVSHAVAGVIRYSLRAGNGKNGRRWQRLVGYSLEALMDHLESLFQAGMTWENYGQWHVDHIIPIAAFEFSSPDDPEFMTCWALDNLQPLWASDNCAKGARLDWHL